MPLSRSCALGVVAAALATGCADPLPCGVTGSSASVPGVTIALSTETCTFQSGAPGTFTYTTTVASPLTFTMGPHAGCSPTLNEPSSFITAQISGGAVRYCPTCDVGVCPEDPGEGITIPAGTYQGQLNWPGRQWNGPSDTGAAPLGDPFPPGAYTVHVVFAIPSGTIDAAMPITVQ